MHAIQQARIDFPSTYIIAIASSQHHDRLRDLGAHATFDYKSPSLVSDVQNLGKDIRKGLDCHSEGQSTVLAAKCMIPREHTASNGSDVERRIIRTLPPTMMSGTPPAGVRTNEWILSYTALGKVWLHATVQGSLANANMPSPSGSSSNIIHRCLTITRSLPPTWKISPVFLDMARWSLWTIDSCPEGWRASAKASKRCETVVSEARNWCVKLVQPEVTMSS